MFNDELLIKKLSERMSELAKAHGLDAGGVVRGAVSDDIIFWVARETQVIGRFIETGNPRRAALVQEKIEGCEWRMVMERETVRHVVSILVSPPPPRAMIVAAIDHAVRGGDVRGVFPAEGEDEEKVAAYLFEPIERAFVHDFPVK